MSVAQRKEDHEAMTKQITEISFTVNPEAVRSFHDDGVVILHAGNGRMFSSNETGARIWRGLEQQLPLETIASEISSAYQIAQGTAREHTLSFLTALEQQALIRREVAA
jgi:Coenzyme PQQ synthesis protein D (PqqD)